MWLGAMLLAHAETVRGAPAAESHELNLAVGENRTLSAARVQSYSEGRPGVAEVRLTPNGKQFVVVGKKPGSTTLLLIMKDKREVLWQVNVFARDVKRVKEELDQLLGDSMGIRVRRVGSRFFIEGGVSTEAEVGRIDRIAKLYEDQVESLVVLGGAAADRGINVRIDVFFVQYERSTLRRLGIDWPGRIGGGAVVGNDFVYDFLDGATVTATASVTNQPLPALDMASRVGHAKVLKHATVITANGSEATFESGGAQNYPVTSGLVASIQRIAFGTNIKVLPRYDPRKRQLEVTVGVDIADLTPPTADTILPGESTSNLETQVALRLGESLVLSGVRVKTERSTNNGIPWLSEIPIIGRLFGSVADDVSEIEGAIFVVPGVMESVPSDSIRFIARALEEYEAYDGDLSEVAPAAGLPGGDLPGGAPSATPLAVPVPAVAPAPAPVPEVSP